MFSTVCPTIQHNQSLSSLLDSKDLWNYQNFTTQIQIDKLYKTLQIPLCSSFSCACVSQNHKADKTLTSTGSIPKCDYSRCQGKPSPNISWKSIHKSVGNPTERWNKEDRKTKPISNHLFQHFQTIQYSTWQNNEKYLWYQQKCNA